MSRVGSKNNALNKDIALKYFLHKKVQSKYGAFIKKENAQLPVSKGYVHLLLTQQSIRTLRHHKADKEGEGRNITPYVITLMLHEKLP